MKRAFVALVLLFAVTPLFAWGEKGHLLVNEAATLSLPNDMPAFFYQAFPQLVWLGPDPDRWRGAGEAEDAVNAPDHFLDYEYVSKVQLPRDRYRFIDLMQKSGTLKRYGIYSSTAGFTPYRIAEMSERLTGEWRLWRAAPAGSADRAAVEHDIIRDAGVLGHYVADASQPLHATINYNGWILPNPEGYANDCTIHARFESNFVSRAIALGDVLPKVDAAPTFRPDYFKTAMEMLATSNKQVELLYRIDKEGGFALFGPVPRSGADYVSTRIAAGASMLRDFWWSTWKASERPPRRRSQTPEE
jgi:hypothetical protein